MISMTVYRVCGFVPLSQTYRELRTMQWVLGTSTVPPFTKRGVHPSEQLAVRISVFRSCPSVELPKYIR